MTETSIDGLLVYHGTCQEKWGAVFSHETALYLTNQPSIAAGYAEEWVVEGMSPVLVRFALSDLIAAQLELQPNWENIEQAEQGLWGDRPMSNWRDTLNASGTFCVFGNVENIKHIGIIVPYKTVPAMA